MLLVKARHWPRHCAMSPRMRTSRKRSLRRRSHFEQLFFLELVLQVHKVRQPIMRPLLRANGSGPISRGHPKDLDSRAKPREDPKENPSGKSLPASPSLGGRRTEENYASTITQWGLQRTMWSTTPMSCEGLLLRSPSSEAQGDHGWCLKGGQFSATRL